MLRFFKRSDPNTKEFIEAKEWFRETYKPKLHPQYASDASKMSPGKDEKLIDKRYITTKLAKNIYYD